MSLAGRGDMSFAGRGDLSFVGRGTDPIPSPVFGRGLG